MDTFVTIKTFTYPSEAYILRGKLESEGVVCFLKDELNVQTNPMNSNAYGGVKLQVKESDIQQTIEILKAGGYKLDDDSSPPKFFVNIASRTSNIPLFKKLPDLFRVLIVFVLLILGSLFLIGFIFQFLHDKLSI